MSLTTPCDCLQSSWWALSFFFNEQKVNLLRGLTAILPQNRYDKTEHHYLVRHGIAPYTFVNKPMYLIFLCILSLTVFTFFYVLLSTGRNKSSQCTARVIALEVVKESSSKPFRQKQFSNLLQQKRGSNHIPSLFLHTLPLCEKLTKDAATASNADHFNHYSDVPGSTSTIHTTHLSEQLHSVFTESNLKNGGRLNSDGDNKSSNCY